MCSNFGRWWLKLTTGRERRGTTTVDVPGGTASASAPCARSFPLASRPLPVAQSLARESGRGALSYACSLLLSFSSLRAAGKRPGGEEGGAGVSLLRPFLGVERGHHHGLAAPTSPSRLLLARSREREENAEGCGIVSPSRGHGDGRGAPRRGEAMSRRSSRGRRRQGAAGGPPRPKRR